MGAEDPTDMAADDDLRNCKDLNWKNFAAIWEKSWRWRDGCLDNKNDPSRLRCVSAASYVVAPFQSGKLLSPRFYMGRMRKSRRDAPCWLNYWLSFFGTWVNHKSFNKSMKMILIETHWSDKSLPRSVFKSKITWLKVLVPMTSRHCCRRFHRRFEAFRSRFPDEEAPAAPLRALRYTSAGGRHVRN